MIPIERLVRRITADELFDLALGALETVGIPARSWRQGSVARSIVAIGAQLGSQGASVLTSCMRGMFLLFGEGDYLTAHAKDVYDVDRIEATFATGPALLTNIRGAVYTLGADELVVRSSNTGARFRVQGAIVAGVVTAPYVIGSGSESSPTEVPIMISAIEAGAASSVAPAEIDELETTLAGVSVTNETTIVGRDAETDTDLVKRCLAKKGTWSPFGPRDAYEYAALSATLEDGSPTSITRVAVSRYSSTGQVLVVCATPTGTPSDDELEAVRREVNLIARPDTVTVTVEGAVPHETTHSIVLWCRGGTEALLLLQAQRALSDLISNYPIGGIRKSDGAPGYLYADAISAACIGSSPEAFDVDFDDASDIELEPNEVATNTTTFDVRIIQ